MTETLKRVLLSIDFKNRYDALFNKHSHRNLFKKADPKEVQRLIEKLGYTCTHHKADKFLKVDDVQPNLSLNLSTGIGIVEFVLDTTVDGEGDGGPLTICVPF
jgi:hypothetical protein